MTKPVVMKVSERGQMSLPAETRHRWGITDGGTVEVFDLDGALLLVPGQDNAVRSAVRLAVRAGRYDAAVALIDDPELSD